MFICAYKMKRFSNYLLSQHKCYIVNKIMNTNEFRAFAAQMTEFIIKYFETIREKYLCFE